MKGDERKKEREGEGGRAFLSFLFLLTTEKEKKNEKKSAHMQSEHTCMSVLCLLMHALRLGADSTPGGVHVGLGCLNVSSLVYVERSKQEIEVENTQT